MNKNIINFIATIIIVLILSQFLPWWAIMVSAFATGLFITLERAAVFFVPFLAIALFWITYSYKLGSSNDFILAKKIAILLPLDGSTSLLLLITGVVGGLAAGIDGVFGKQCSILLKKN